MSFAAIQGRLMMLISMQYDIELQTQFILQHKMYLQKSVGGFMNMKAEYDPGSQADRVLEARIHQLSGAEKILETRLAQLGNQSKAISAEREQVTQTLSQNIQRSFKNAYGGGG